MTSSVTIINLRRERNFFSSLLPFSSSSLHKEESLLDHKFIIPINIRTSSQGIIKIHIAIN